MSDNELFAFDQLNDSDEEGETLESLDSENARIRSLLKQAGVVATPNDSNDDDADIHPKRRRRAIPTIGNADPQAATQAAPITTPVALQPFDFRPTTHHHVTLEPLDIPLMPLQNASQVHGHPGALSPLALHDTHVLPPLPDRYPTGQASNHPEDTGAHNAGGDTAGPDHSRQWASFLQLAPANAKGLLKEVQDAMARNLRLQTVMRDQLAVINSTIEANERLRKRVVRVIISQRSYARTSETRHGFRYPYFKDAEGKCPPPNADALQRKLNAEKRLFTFRHRPWVPNELQALKEEVCKQNRDLQVKPLLTEVERLISTRLATNDTSLRPQIEVLLQHVERVRKDPLDHFAYDLGHINWMTLPQTRPELRKRTPEECRIQWTNVSHPIVNTGPWTKEEDVKILEMARTFEQPNWPMIAESLGTYRTPAACFKRYQMSLNPALLKREWTEEEDQQLKEAVMEYGIGNWNEMRGSLPGRTGQQLLHRWKAIDPTIRKGKWTAEEDDLLMAAVARHGLPNWRSISAHVPRRTDAQCRERYNNVLNPALSTRPWTADEDATLLSMIEECTTENGISVGGGGVRCAGRMQHSTVRTGSQENRPCPVHAENRTITSSQHRAIEAKAHRKSLLSSGARVNRLRAEIADPERGAEERDCNATSEQPTADEALGDARTAAEIMVQRLGGHVPVPRPGVFTAPTPRPPIVPPLPPTGGSLRAFERMQQDLDTYGSGNENGLDADGGEAPGPRAAPQFHLPSHHDPNTRRLYDRMHALFRWPNYLANNHPPTVVMTKVGASGRQNTAPNSQLVTHRMPISRPSPTTFTLFGPNVPERRGRGRKKKVPESTSVTESDSSIPISEGRERPGTAANGGSGPADEATPTLRAQSKKGGKKVPVSKNGVLGRKKKDAAATRGNETTQQHNGVSVPPEVSDSAVNGPDGEKVPMIEEDSAVLDGDGVGVPGAGRGKRVRAQQGGRVQKARRTSASGGKAKKK